MHSLTLYIICGLFLCRHTTAQWAPYPTCAQPFLNANEPTDCMFGWLTQQEVDQTNACLCVSQGFLNNAAQAIYNNCGCDDLITSASLIVTACGISGTTSAYDEAQIISAGVRGQSACQNINASSVPAPGPTSTVTESITVPPTPIASNGGNGNGNGINGNGTTQTVNIKKSSADGLSSPSKIAVGVTVPVALLALAGFLWYAIRKQRQRRRLMRQIPSREAAVELDNRSISYKREQWEIKPELGANEAQRPELNELL